MNLVVASFLHLNQVYGERTTRRVVSAIEQVVAARAALGVESRLLLIEEGLADLAVAGVAVSSGAIAAQLGQAATALERMGDSLESVLIIGGHAVIPFDLAPNPTAYDGDVAVPSDTCYSTRTVGALVAEWPVGRIPGDEGPGASGVLLVQLLEQAAELHWRGPRPLVKTFGYSTAVWYEATAQIYGALSVAPALLSPPTVAASLDLALLDGADAVYCNLHGVRDGPVWYGQANQAGGYLVALRPEDVLRIKLDGAVVVSEACYGAVVAGRDQRTSLALAFLARGAACFVGATAMSYGPANAPLSEADLLTLHFWRAVRGGGTTIGAAFVAARNAMLRDTLANHAVLDDDDRKTALEFVLYGDPTLVC